MGYIAGGLIFIVIALVYIAVCINRHRQRASKVRAVWPNAKACLHASVPGPHAWTSLLKQCMRESARLAGVSCADSQPKHRQYAEVQGELSGAVLL